jgi:hypothetical protein
MNWKEVKNAVGSMEVRYGLCGGGKIGLLFYRLRGCGLGRGTDKWTHLVWFFNSSFFAFLVWFFNSSFFSVQPRCVVRLRGNFSERLNLCSRRALGFTLAPGDGCRLGLVKLI